MTVTAKNEEDARAALMDALEAVPGLQIVNVIEVAELPHDTTLEAPRTLQ